MLEAATGRESSDVPERSHLIDALSRRESEVLSLVSLGLSNNQIAGRLAVTTHAIKFHLSSIYRKLGVANRTEASARYLRAERTREVT